MKSAHRYARTTRRSRASLLVLTVMTAVGAMDSARAQGWQYLPSPRDWETWPIYCRVQYSFINKSQNAYSRFYSEADYAPWRAAIGERTFGPLHHYCKALIILREARRERDPKNRQYLIGVAIDDGHFSYERADPQSIVFPQIASVLAEAHYLNGELSRAEQILRHAIEMQPTSFASYATLAKIYREAKRPQQALAVMQDANTATKGESADVRYSLGLLELELGNPDAAVEHARMVYARGYPVEGLKNRLKRINRWPPPPPPPSPPNGAPALAPGGAPPENAMPSPIAPPGPAVPADTAVQRRH